MNQSLFLAINSLAGRNAAVDRGAVVVASYLPLLFVAFLLWLWFARQGFRERVLAAGENALLALGINLAITLGYFHPRPFMVQRVHLLIRHAPETSFPSDHATFMFALAFPLLAEARLRGAALVLAVLALVGGTARVFCGVHYPFDVLGSALVALTATVLTRFPFARPVAALNRAILHRYDLLAARLVATRH